MAGVCCGASEGGGRVGSLVDWDREDLCPSSGRDTVSGTRREGLKFPPKKCDRIVSSSSSSAMRPSPQTELAASEPVWQLESLSSSLWQESSISSDLRSQS